MNETLGPKSIVKLCQQVDGPNEKLPKTLRKHAFKYLKATAIPLWKRATTDQFQTSSWVKSLECDAGQLSPAHYGLNVGPALSPGTFGITWGYIWRNSFMILQL